MSGRLAVSEEADGIVVIAMAQDGGQDLAEALQDRLEAGHRAFVVDFHAVSFINSINIAGIITARNLVIGAGGRLELANMAPAVRSIFHTLKLGRLFDLEQDLAEAVAAARG